MNTILTLAGIGFVLTSVALGYCFPEKSVLIAPHAITVAAILAGIIAAVQSVLSARIDRSAPHFDRESKVSKAEAKELLRGMYDQLLIYMLVIVSALIVIWLNPQGTDHCLLERVSSVFFMLLFSFAIIMTLRMPGYLRALAD